MPAVPRANDPNNTQQTPSIMMWQTTLIQWQQNLLNRLELALGRKLGESDVPCVAWNPAAETLTVAAQPLLGELKAQNLISNVFRAANRGRRSWPAPESR